MTGTGTQEEAPERPARLFLVEDDRATSAGMVRILQEMGYEVCGTAATGEEAVEKVRQLAPDLIIMDIELAGPMTGIDAADSIRQTSRTPVVFLSAFSDDEYIRKAKLTEPFGYILKPVRVPELRSTVEMALYRHAMEKKLHEQAPEETNKALLVRKALSGITLVLYGPDVNRFALFKHVLEEGLASKVECLYAFYGTNLVSRFSPQIASGQLRMIELREGTGTFTTIFSQACSEAERAGPSRRILCIADISNLADPGNLRYVKEVFLRAEEMPGAVFSGILAVPIAGLEGSLREEIFAGVHNFIWLSGEETLVSFSPPARDSRSAEVVSQEIMDNVVRRSLEVLILTCLSRPISGFDIIKDIRERFHVAIPLASVYTYLYGLEKQGFLTTTRRGGARVYTPTKEGEKYLRNRLGEITAAYDRVLGTGR